MSSTDQGGRLSDALADAMRRRFVGRGAELRLFQDVLEGAGEPLAALHLTGPGGVGKTTLLHELARVAESRGRPALRLDGRQLDPTPAALAAALADGDLAPGTVVLVDSYELLAPIDAWLRAELLPRLPSDALLVLAGRHSPDAWLGDGAWAAATRHVALANFSADEGAAYLVARGLPQDQHAAALRLTRGHPLALSLLADLHRPGRPPVAAEIGDRPDVLGVLLERFLRDVPTARHRRALELAAIARTTTEGLLASALGREDAFELFRWMRQLSFVEVGPAGLAPHDLVRDALDADLHWRDPDGYAELRRAALAFLRARAAVAEGLERQRLRLEILFANRRDPGLRPFFAWESADVAYAEPARPEDMPALAALVERHEGPESAAVARHWQRRQPERFLVFRTPAGERHGFMLQLALERVTDEDCAADPAVAAAVEFLRSRRPLRSGEAASHMRFWMADEGYQAISPALNLTAANCIVHWTTTPGLVWSFVAMAAPDLMAPHFASIRFARTPEADFAVGGRRYGVFSHSWELDPPEVWRTEAQRADLPASSALALADAELVGAVRQALRDYTRPDLLAASPLLRTALLPESGRTPDALRALLREAVESLAGNPRDARLSRALWRTYIEPAETQERAAELLGLPFNTYRSHLAKGIERVAAWLQRRAAPPSP